MRLNTSSAPVHPAAAGVAPDQGVCDQHPLLLTARQVADPLIGEPRRVHRFKHLVDLSAAP